MQCEQYATLGCSKGKGGVGSFCFYFVGGEVSQTLVLQVQFPKFSRILNCTLFLHKQAVITVRKLITISLKSSAICQYVEVIMRSTRKGFYILVNIAVEINIAYCQLNKLCTVPFWCFFNFFIYPH